MNCYGLTIVVVMIGIFSNIAQCGEPEQFLESEPITLNTGIRTGRVIDAVTGEPIQGAVILFMWDIEEFLIESHTSLGALYETTTDRDGKYLIPSQTIEIKHPQMSNLKPEEVIVYKHGYVRYRVFNSKARAFIIYLPDLQLEYRKENNVVKLQPWTNELSHSEHIAFLTTGLSRPRGKLLQQALEKEKALAEKEQWANKPFQQKVIKAKKQLYQNQAAYKKGKITKEEYIARLHKYLQIPDSNLLKLTSLALKDLDDTTAIPALIKFLKENMYRKSFEEAFYSLHWAIGNKDLKAPKSVPQRKDFVAEIEGWWERNKDRSSEDWNIDDITNFSSISKNKVITTPVRDGDMLVDPALQKFDDLNNSPLAVFKKFRAALLTDDFEKVTSCFAPYKRAEHAEIYKKLRPYFGNMAEDMRGLVLKSRSDNVVECELLRQEGDSISAYPIIFMKDEDGNWWIQEL